MCHRKWINSFNLQKTTTTTKKPCLADTIVISIHRRGKLRPRRHDLARGYTVSKWWSQDWASQVVLVVQNLPANSGDVSNAGSIPGWGRSPEGGHDNPLQYSCLENPMDRGAWWATVHGVGKGWT